MEYFKAELLGTLILILINNGAVAAVLLARSQAQGAGWLVMALGTGAAVSLSVYAVGRVSGGHINPAVTLGLAVAGEVDWGLVPWYWAGQFLGGFLGAVLVWLAYPLHWAQTPDPGVKLSVFATTPAIRFPIANPLTEALATALLVFGVRAILANELAPGLPPLLIGLLVLGIALGLGGPTGYAINPARDLAPRFAHALLPIPGKGDSDWGYAWVPAVGPLPGGVLGSLAFEWMG